MKYNMESSTIPIYASTPGHTLFEIKDAAVIESPKKSDKILRLE